MFGSGANRKPLPPFEIVHSTLEPPEDLIAVIGEINMATTQIIADQFDLSHDELLNGLPLIDMSKTKFWPICPLLVKQDLKCELTRFRTFTGHCNNIKHPTWGAAMTPFARYLPPVHPDGIWVPRKSVVMEHTIQNDDHFGGGGENPSSLHNSALLGLGNMNEEHDDNDEMSNNNRHLEEPIGNDHNSIEIIDHTNHKINNIDGGDNGDSLGEHRHRSNSVRVPTMPMPVHHHDHIHHHIHTTNEMVSASSSSVKFVRHDVYPRAVAVGGNLGSQSVPSEFDTHSISHLGNYPAEPSLSASSSSMTIPSPPVGSHYQVSHSPGRPFFATSTPISVHNQHNGAPHHQVAQFQQSVSSKQHQHPLLSASASNPMHQFFKSRSKTALELPSARLVTSIVHRDVDLPNHDFTILFMSWGQLLDHDLTRAAQSPSCKSSSTTC